MQDPDGTENKYEMDERPKVERREWESEEAKDRVDFQIEHSVLMNFPFRHIPAPPLPGQSFHTAAPRRPNTLCLASRQPCPMEDGASTAFDSFSAKKKRKEGGGPDGRSIALLSWLCAVTTDVAVSVNPNPSCSMHDARTHGSNIRYEHRYLDCTCRERVSIRGKKAALIPSRWK